MVSGWYLFKKDRKTSIRLTWFLIVMLIIAVVIGIFFPESNKPKTHEKDQETTDIKKK